MNAAIEWGSLTPGQHRLACPACGRDRRSDKTLGVTIDHSGKGVAHCFRCSYVETHHPDHNDHNDCHRQPHRRDPLPRVAVQTPVQHETLSAAGRAQWHAAHPIVPGTPAAHYLNMRVCALPPTDGHLRWLPAHRHPSGHVGPVLVALLTDAVTAEWKSLHFTWIEGGRKADVHPPRLLLKGHRKAGTVCRLWPDELVTSGLAVAEGIETALSVAHVFTPSWAAIDANNMAALPVLAGVDSVLIAVDRDPAGEKAAAALASRWVAAGRSVWATNQRSGDMNDLVAAAASGVPL